MPLLGKPLVAWTIEFALCYRGFSSVCVSTDSEDVRLVACRFGLDVTELRPAALATDDASTLDVVRFETKKAERGGDTFDYVAVLQPTTPFRCAATWNEAAALLGGGAPGVVGVSRVDPACLWAYFRGDDGSIQPCFPQYATLRSQDLPQLYVPNGSMYWIRRHELMREDSLVPPGARSVIVRDPREAIDIDTAEDFALAERMLSDVVGS